MRTHTVIDSPIGALTLVNTDGVLSGLYMDVPGRSPAAATIGVRTTDGFAQAVEELDEYFARQRTDFTVPLAPSGTPFQLAVWRELSRIPYGQTRTYAQIATAVTAGGDAVGDWTIARAVGAANARNPIAIVVPCHRVIGADGSLTGYAGGLERKEFLLALENPARVVAEPLFR